MVTTELLTPDFIVIGAMKAGTTSLYHVLAAHPEIGMSRLKETDYFIAERNFVRGQEWYASQFTPGFRLYGEASPNYTKARDFPGVPERIRAQAPRAKLIYLMRDPVQRFVSQYNHSWLTGALRETPREIRGGHEWRHILDASLYHAQLSRYWRCFERDRLLLVELEAMIAHPERELARIAAFLGLERPLAPTSRAENSADSVAATPSLFYSLRRLGVTDALRPLLPPSVERMLKRAIARGPKRRAPAFEPELRAEVAEAVRDDVARLRAETGLAFASWSV